MKYRALWLALQSTAGMVNGLFGHGGSSQLSMMQSPEMMWRRKYWRISPGGGSSIILAQQAKSHPAQLASFIIGTSLG